MLLGLGTPSPVPAPMPFGSLSRPGLVLERLICDFPGVAPECVRGQGWREKGEGGDQGQRGGGFERDKPREFSVRRKLGGVIRERQGWWLFSGRAPQLFRVEMSMWGRNGIRKSFLMENLGH